MAPTTINIRTDSDVKKQAEEICNALGMNLSTAINVFLRKMIIKNGIPFSLTLDQPNQETIKAFEEAEEIYRDPNRKTYNSFKEIRQELGV